MDQLRFLRMYLLFSITFYPPPPRDKHISFSQQTKIIFSFFGREQSVILSSKIVKISHWKFPCYIIKYLHRSCLFINIIWRQYPSSGRSLIISLFNDCNLYNYESYISYLKNVISNWLRGGIFSPWWTRAWVMVFLMTKIKVTSPKQYIYIIHCIQLLFSK